MTVEAAGARKDGVTTVYRLSATDSAQTARGESPTAATKPPPPRRWGHGGRRATGVYTDVGGPAAAGRRRGWWWWRVEGVTRTIVRIAQAAILSRVSVRGLI